LQFLLRACRIAIIGVCILIVSIPEGLPLAVSVAMALSINRLKNNNILIKNLQAVQTCSMLHDVCIGKTGTLTKGKMQVKKYILGESTLAAPHDPNRQANREIQEDFDSIDQINAEAKELFFDSILGNSEARFEPDQDTMKYEARGSPIGVAMLKFIIDNGVDAYTDLLKRNSNQPLKLLVPFDQERKT
jgi:magnesium-transporting ATPase (P-type)